MNPFVKAVLLSVSLAAPAWAAAPPMPDALITSNTKLLLWTTAGVRSTGVHVDTNEGVVTLYGKVPTEAQRELASRTASGVGGVKSVKSLLQVVPVREEQATARSDNDVKLAVDKELKAPALAASWITVKSVDKGVVLLSGQAHSYGDYLRALWATDSVPGVKRIVSEVKAPGDFREDERLTFTEKSRAALDAKVAEAKVTASDLRITTDVKMRLWTSAQVPSTEISVDTVDGVVTLFGTVPTAAVKSAAGGEAIKVSGVHKLSNELEIVSSSARAAVEAKDADISRDVALALKDQPALESVKPWVNNGTVRLTGSVPSGWDTLDAVRVVRRVLGVHNVLNELTVGTAVSRN